MLGDPCACQAGSLRGQGGLHRGCEGTTLGHAGELARQQEQPELHGEPQGARRAPAQQSRPPR